MQVALLLVLASGCGSFVRNDILAGPIYDACMEKKMANRSDKEADKTCVRHAREEAEARIDAQSTTTVCRHYGNTSVCESDR